jgi:hypothetical protein
MNDAIAHAFAVAGFWTCFVSAAVVLGIGGAELLTKLDNAARRQVDPR